uniref:Uncharacterized protein n=1 Tax=Acrobeloides nanus TaxID=290746 RepID=A0A914DSL8_9BILA
MDLSWLHRLLEMVFGELYTDFLASSQSEKVEASTFQPTFEAALKPWIKNITSPRPTYKMPVTMPSLPYPHIFTTPKPNRKVFTPATTPPPAIVTATGQEETTTLSFLDRLTAAFTENEDLLFSSKSNFFSSKTVGAAESSKSCETCKPGKSCSAKLNSFETNDPVFRYAYEHGSGWNELLDYVMKETQAVQLPPPLAWKESATPEVVQLTMNLMSLYRPNRSLVIGVFTGLALIGVSSVTDPRGIVVGLEYPELVHYWEKIGIKHAQRAGIMNRIQIRSVEGIERSLQKLAAYEPNAFDFILLDDVKKSNYLDDYEHSVRLLRNGGLLIITDVSFKGPVYF